MRRTLSCINCKYRKYDLLIIVVIVIFLIHLILDWLGTQTKSTAITFCTSITFCYAMARIKQWKIISKLLFQISLFSTTDLRNSDLNYGLKLSSHNLCRWALTIKAMFLFFIQNSLYMQFKVLLYWMLLIKLNWPFEKIQDFESDI